MRRPFSLYGPSWKDEKVPPPAVKTVAAGGPAQPLLGIDLGSKHLQVLLEHRQHRGVDIFEGLLVAVVARLLGRQLDLVFALLDIWCHTSARVSRSSRCCAGRQTP